MTIRANGELSETINNGSKVHVTVKWGILTLINKGFDLCDNSNVINRECPLEEGVLNIMKEVAVPDAIPPGKYVVIADVFTNFEAGGRKTVICVTGSVQF